MDWPQVTMIVLMGIAVGGGLVEVSRPGSKVSDFVQLLVAQAILLTILVCGGFWS